MFDAQPDNFRFRRRGESTHFLNMQREWLLFRQGFLQAGLHRGDVRFFKFTQELKGQVDILNIDPFNRLGNAAAQTGKKLLDFRQIFPTEFTGEESSDVCRKHVNSI